jgi:hypothetical protein
MKIEAPSVGHRTDEGRPRLIHGLDRIADLLDSHKRIPDSLEA